MPLESPAFRRGLVTGLLAAGALAACLAWALPANAQAPIVMKLATPTLNDGQHEFLKRFAAAAEQASNGRIKAEIYPAGQLGPVPREVEQTQLGAIAGFVTPAEYLDSVDSRFQVLSASGLFQDMNHVDRATKDPEFRKAFFEVGQKRGVRVAAVFLSGPAGLDTRIPVAHLSDLKGLKIRVLASPLQMKPIAALGATPVPISLGDVLPALQQGTIDGVLSSLPVLAAFKYYDAAKYFTETDLGFVVSTFVFSRTWYDKLPPDLQQILATQALTVGDAMHPWLIDFYNTQRKAWIDGGGQVSRVPDAERAAAMVQLAAVTQEVVAGNPDLKSIYDIALAAAQRTR
jgi:TRAP-type C4-dicarboxylate transport system substrate-binding protein